MEFCIISPIEGLERYSTLSKTHLVLAQVADQRYVNFYTKRRIAGDTLILDNGAYEKGKSVDWYQLELAIMRYDPQVCVLPDTVNNPTQTLSDSLRFLDKNISRFPKTEWMYMVHRHPKSSPTTLHHLDAVSSAIYDRRVGNAITWLGIPRCLTTDQDVNRVGLAKGLLPHEKKLHAMGMIKGSVSELNSLHASGLFQSIDSSAPVWRGWRGRSLNDSKWDEVPIQFNAEDPDLHRDDFSRHDLILKNLEACGVNTKRNDV